MADDWERWNHEKAATYVVEGLKAALLLNGGAAGALLAFIGTYVASTAKEPGATVAKVTIDPSYIAWALRAFGAGAFFAAAAFCLAYIAQVSFAERARKSTASRTPEVLTGVGLLLYALSMIGFCCGVWIASTAIKL